MNKTTCCICRKKINIADSHNPYPVRKWSATGSAKNRCCSECNEEYVIKFRMVLFPMKAEDEKHAHKVLCSRNRAQLDQLKKDLYMD